MKTLFRLIALLAFFMPGCTPKKDDITPDNAFPDHIGDQFIYKVTDSLNNKTYNVTVSVTGKTKLSNGQSAYIWTYQYPDHIGTSYVLDTQDSVTFYGNTEITDSTKIAILDVYHFPLTVGAKWQVSFQRDTAAVVSSSPVNINGKTYNNAYLIRESGRSYNYSITKNTWFEPNVGLIRMDHITQGQFDTWQLISYNLK